VSVNTGQLSEEQHLEEDMKIYQGDAVRTSLCAYAATIYRGGRAPGFTAVPSKVPRPRILLRGRGCEVDGRNSQSVTPGVAKPGVSH
jgi:hypothetical protein